MPKDHWARNARRKQYLKERSVKPAVTEAWALFSRTMRGELDQDTVEQDHPVAERTEPVRPAYDDFPAVTSYSVYRQYDPEFYGRPAGTHWPVTAAEAVSLNHP